MPLRGCHEKPLYEDASSAVRHAGEAVQSVLCCFRERECIVDVDTKISDGILDLAVTEQNLNGSQIPRGLVDNRRLGSAQRVRAVFLRRQANGANPFVHQASILPGAEMAIRMDAAWKCEVVYAASATLKPTGLPSRLR